MCTSKPVLAASLENISCKKMHHKLITCHCSFHVAQLHSNLKMRPDLVHPEQKALVSHLLYNPVNHTCTPSSYLTFNKNSLHACTVKKRFLIGPIYTVLNLQLWNLKPMQHASSFFFCFFNYTINTCCASSLVGANTSAWVSLNSISNCCRMEIANVAVLPVPDWAWAITSYPKKSRIHIYRSHIKPSLLVYTMYSIWNMKYAQIIKWSAMSILFISGQSRKMIAIISL